MPIIKSTRVMTYEELMKICLLKKRKGRQGSSLTCSCYSLRCQIDQITSFSNMSAIAMSSTETKRRFSLQLLPSINNRTDTNFY